MSLIKIVDTKFYQDKLLFETAYALKKYSEKYGSDNEDYGRLYKEFLTCIKELANTSNLVVPIPLNDNTVGVFELDFADDGRSYRITNYLEQPDGEYVELLEVG